MLFFFFQKTLKPNTRYIYYIVCVRVCRFYTAKVISISKLIKTDNVSTKARKEFSFEEREREKETHTHDIILYRYRTGKNGEKRSVVSVRSHFKTRLKYIFICARRVWSEPCNNRNRRWMVK